MMTATPEQRHLAALIDGEPGPGGFDIAIRAVEQDAELRKRFERGLLIGQVLRGEPTLTQARFINQRVARSLAAEPVAMRPRQPTRRGRSLNRPAAALALAASLVAVAVLVGPGLLLGPGETEPQLAATRDAAFRPVDVEVRGAEPNLVARWSMGDPAGTTALDALLVDHRERASASGLTGFIPYAAVVGQSGVR